MALTAIERLIKQNTGIDSHIIGSESLRHFIDRRMESVNIPSYSAYLDLIEKSSGEFQSLINLITIPETWFFRDAEPFNYLKQYIEQEWPAQGKAGTVSILSLPCSTGEEPYSIAITLMESGLSPSKFHIDAYDINLKSLEKAKRASYGGNSFRGQCLEFREKYFARVDDRFQLESSIAKTVNFYHGNALKILEKVSGRLYNIIFCRNLMIYFDRDTQQLLLSQLQKLLVSGGRIFLGHAESSELVLSMFKSTGGKGSFAYEPRSADSDWIDPNQYATSLAPTVYPIVKVYTNKPVDLKKTSSLKRTVRNMKLIDNSLVRDIERKADNGEMDEASRLCALLVEQGIDDANVLCLCGVINEVRGDLDQAGDLFKRAIEIDPDHYDAIVHLAVNLESRGLADEASVLRKRAKEIAAKDGKSQ
jgi:chemotaxis protein methyltransferase WspC